VAVRVPASLLLSRSSGLEDPVLGPLLDNLAPDLQSESNDFDESTAFIALQVLHAARLAQRGEPTMWGPYVASLPPDVATPLLWDRTAQEQFLRGTSLHRDTRELLAENAMEFRRLRRSLLREDPAWLGRFGLDEQVAACPLSGETSPAARRWLLATCLVRSRAYMVYTKGAGEDQDDGDDEDEGEDEDEDEGDLADLMESSELVLAPVVDLANHEEGLTRAVCWGEPVALSSASSELLLICERAVAKGEPVPSTYGAHTRSSSLLTFGFCLPEQPPSATLRLAVDASDPFLVQKLAVLEAAGEDRVSVFELRPPSVAPPPMVGEDDDEVISGVRAPGGAQHDALDERVLQLLRLLALPPADAKRLLGDVAPASGQRGFGVAPVLSAAGEDVWDVLATPGARSIERAALARLIRECRSMTCALDGALKGPVTGFGAQPLHLVQAAALVRKGEADALRETLSAARAAGRALV